jgi:hypothetical protein
MCDRVRWVASGVDLSIESGEGIVKLSNRKGKFVFIILAAASLAAGGISALGAVGAKLGLEESSAERARRQRT